MILELNNIQTYYGHSHILHGVSMQVPDGKCVALLGRNGVGKTTTLRSIMGLTPPKEGTVVFNGKELQNLPAYEISNLGVGYVPQGRRLFKSLTVLEHLEVYHRPGDRWNPEKALDFFPRLKERLSNKGGELSGGEQQMLAIARALVMNPDIVIMDEPTEGLSPLIVSEVGKLVKRLKAEGQAILLTEQKLKFALEIADEVYIMSKGQIVFHGTPDEIRGDDELKRVYLGV